MLSTESKNGQVEEDQEVDGEATSYPEEMNEAAAGCSQNFRADFHADSKGK
jgi:hypothetical protein